MKKILFTLCLFTTLISKAQIICVFCYEQNDSISSNVNNLIQNGSFELGCNNFGYFCPNSNTYSCNLSNWICSGGGSMTYACTYDTSVHVCETPDGRNVAYFGNGVSTRACSPAMFDTSCMADSGCVAINIQPGYPYSDTGYGGANGVTIAQTVNGLVAGNSYVLEFWAGGEGQSAGWMKRGLFAVDVGFGNTFLRCNPTNPGYIGTRYLIVFNATSSSHTIKFTSWGHICGVCTELMLDHVRLYTLAEISPNVPPCAGANLLALFTAPNHICPGTCTGFTNLSTNATSYIWTFPGGTPGTSTDVNPSTICYNSPGNYSVQLIASNATSSDTLLLPNYITVYPNPLPQGITQHGDTLLANQGATSYQWYLNGTLISGATNYNYVALVSGDYNVVATDDNGCEVEAVIFNVIADVQSLVNSHWSLELFPNPVAGELEIKNEKLRIEIRDIAVYNVMGEMVLRPTVSNQNSKSISVDVAMLSTGMYYLELTSRSKILRAKFVKE